ncbi:defensin coprisin-like [Rhodnius prolixus]|uniref:INVERT_DEFENSINS domain-containing protein n=1 Tax=Rhodnius prolixus TaxID=13249 RepID=T1I7I7_RHOPR
MKCILSLVTLWFLVAAMVYSYPAELILQQHLDDALRKPAGEITEVHLTRRKRALCEEFTFEYQWCIAHCLVLGYNGGHCKDSICHCTN